MNSKRKISLKFNDNDIKLRDNKRICKNGISKRIAELDNYFNMVSNFDIIEKIDKMVKTMEKIKNMMEVMNKRVANIESIVEKDIKKDLEIDELNHSIKCLKLNNYELKYKLETDGKEIKNNFYY
jgi:hypothetical protein